MSSETNTTTTKQEEAEAYYSLGKEYFDKYNESNDPKLLEKAIKYYKIAYDNGFEEACVKLGITYM